MTDMDYYGEFAEMAPLLVTRSRLREAGLDAGLRLILPHLMLPGVTKAYGLDVVRASVSEPLLGVPGESDD